MVHFGPPAEKFSLETPEVWSTDNKNFDRWICQLVYCMIALCEDVPIRYLFSSSLP